MATERRKHRRKLVSQPVAVLRRDGSLIADCVLRDISVGGARLQFLGAVDVPRELSLRMAGKVQRHCEVVWQRNFEMGVRFVNVETGIIDLNVVAREIEYL